MERATAFLILLAIVILSAYDVVVAIFHSPAATVSGVLLDTAREYPVVPFALAALMGHIWGEHRAIEPLRDVLRAHLWLVILAGLMAGALLWPNR